MSYLRKYAVTLDATTAGSMKVRVSIRTAAGTAFATSSDWTPGAGDVTVSKDGGATANIGTLPAYSNGQWEFVLSGTELTAKNVHVVVIDAAVEPFDFTIETFGNASAMYPNDYVDVVRMGMTALPNAAAEAAGGLYTRGTGAGQINQDANGRIDANAKAWNSTGVTATSGAPDVNTTQWASTPVSATVGGIPDVNLAYWLGTAVPAINALVERPLSNGTVASTTGTTTTLDAGSAATASYYVNAILKIVSGTGAGQERVITAYTSGRVATHAAWTTNPTAASTYQIVSGLAGAVIGAVGSVTGNVGGNVVGTVASVVGAVGSVTGNVGGNVTGTVASVVGNVGGNVVGTVASVVGAVGSVTGNVGGNLTGSVGSVVADVNANVAQVNGSTTAAKVLAGSNTPAANCMTAAHSLGDFNYLRLLNDGSIPDGLGVGWRVLYFDQVVTVAAFGTVAGVDNVITPDVPFTATSNEGGQSVALLAPADVNVVSVNGDPANPVAGGNEEETIIFEETIIR